MQQNIRTAILTFILILSFNTEVFSKDNKNTKELTILAQKGIEYGYSLPKVENPQSISREENVKKCTTMNTVIEQYYCIFGVMGKSFDKKMLIIDDITDTNFELIAKLANKELHHIGHHGYGIYKK